MSDPLSRRTIISLIATLPLGVAAVTNLASAADPDDSAGTKAQFKYQPTPGPGGKTCAACTLFKAPSGCVIVKGTIAPAGYCTAFAAK
jgi:hypothetical protein